MTLWKRWIRKLLLPLFLIGSLRGRGRVSLGRRPWRNGIALAAVLALAGWGLWLWLAPKPAPQVLTAEVTRADLEDVVLASGVLKPLRQVDVGAQASGQLKTLNVEAGDRVRKGELLAEIDPENSLNDLKASEAQLESRVAQLRSKQATLRQAERELARQKQMMGEGSTSQKDLLTAETNYQTQTAELDDLQAQIRQNRFQIDKNRTTLGYTRITAPMDGEVIEIVTQQGQTVIASQTVPVILKLADLSTMTVHTQVAEADVIRVKAGLPVYFTVLGAPDRPIRGKLRAILPTPEKINNANFYKALFDVKNVDGKLRVEMTAQVSIVLAESKQALSIPLSALGAAGKDGRYSVKVQGKDGQLHERQVRIGLKTATRVQILDGLKAGEKVVTSEGGGKEEEPSGGVMVSA
ncbi:macrolide transporter subunit MacA [Chromobacterium haemolyticum]|uniref:macrolide transporter subunit MacA n=1 Tax=Chromobacterium haemolyticum TaxID=394935 RepID=UPI0005B8DAE3|nr:macrolide transporter subunit MacA [Chromobacterium haemolyticum]